MGDLTSSLDRMMERIGEGELRSQLTASQQKLVDILIRQGRITATSSGKDWWLEKSHPSEHASRFKPRPLPKSGPLPEEPPF